MFGHVLQIFKNKSEEAFKNSRKNESVSNKNGLRNNARGAANNNVEMFQASLGLCLGVHIMNAT